TATAATTSRCRTRMPACMWSVGYRNGPSTKCKRSGRMPLVAVWVCTPSVPSIASGPRKRACCSATHRFPQSNWAPRPRCWASASTKSNLLTPMIEFFDYLPSQNAFKVRTLLHQLGIPHRTTCVSIFEGEGHKPEYRAINPTGAAIPTRATSYEAAGDETGLDPNELLERLGIL